MIQNNGGRGKYFCPTTYNFLAIAMNITPGGIKLNAGVG